MTPRQSTRPSTAALTGRRILVTGASGFLGTHLVKALEEAHADVRKLEGDIRDRAVVTDTARAVRPEVVFHLAAYGVTPVQGDEPRMHDTNVGGIVHLWEAIMRWASGRCRLVQTGTCGEYGPARGSLAEDHPCHPQSVYAQTVHEAVLYSCDRARRSGRELIVLRPFGPYGPGDRPERLVPHVIDRLLAGERVAVTSGAQRRDYSYVSDHVRALVLAATEPLADTARIYNIGSGRAITVRTMVEATASAVGPDAVARVDFGATPARPSDAWDMFADITAGRRDLGFEPTVPLPDGLADTVRWHRTARSTARPTAGERVLS